MAARYQGGRPYIRSLFFASIRMSKSTVVFNVVREITPIHSRLADSIIL